LTTVGVLGSRRRAIVDELGVVAPCDVGWHLAWWIGADDRWRLPAREATVRQTLEESMPVVRTAMRVPGGDAVHHVYAAVGAGDPIVVEVENDSPSPFVVAFVVRGARAVAVDGGLVVLDGQPALIAPRAPSRWSTSIGGTTEVEVCSGGAHTGAFAPVRDRSARIEAAFLHPVTHRTSLRIALLHALDAEPVDPRALASPSEAARGWRAQLAHGMRADLPDGRLMAAVDSARAEVLLAAGAHRPDGGVVAALEDWGFDAEAAAAWSRLSGRERRRARRRAGRDATWRRVNDAAAAGGAPLLLGLRALLVDDAGSDITILRDLPESWRGAPIEVHDAPTRRGMVSYAVRWHADRPVLLWDAPQGVRLRAPGLDRQWSTTDGQGETLFAAPSGAP
jgi:hypothetical protein